MRLVFAYVLALVCLSLPALAEENYTSADQQAPAMTVVPGLGAPEAVKTDQDLKNQALIYGLDKDHDGVPDELEKEEKLPEKALKELNAPRMRINGMLPDEYSAKASVDAAMASVTDKKLSEAVRAQNAQKAYQKLASLAEAMRHKLSLPDRLYKGRGLSDTFISEEKEGATKALGHLDAALEQLKAYQ